jgi:hypothetical protein
MEREKKGHIEVYIKIKRQSASVVPARQDKERL